MFISVIIPAYNEEKNVEKVLKAVLKADFIDETIVVNDGSSDNTLDILNKFKDKIKVISYEKNRGKGYALKQGILASKNDTLVFLDADLIGLDSNNIRKLVSPVLENKADMVVGILDKKIKKATNLASNFTKNLSGQRALRRKLLCNALDKFDDARFGVEILITEHMKETRARVKRIELKGVSQVVKEKKSKNVAEGFKARMKMYKDIIKTYSREKAKKLDKKLRKV